MGGRRRQVRARDERGLNVAKVEGGREVEAAGAAYRFGEGPLGRRHQRWRAGPGAGRRRLLVVCQAAGLGAVGCSVCLLVAGEAELMCPVERHGERERD